MKSIRWLVGGALMIIGGYLALVSLLVGCTIQNQAMADGSATQWFLFAQGLPPSIGTWIVGAIGMLLIGLGYSIAAGGKQT